MQNLEVKNLETKITPKEEALAKFKQVFGERTEVYTKYMLLNDDRIVGMIIEPISVNEVKNRMKLGQLTITCKIGVYQEPLKNEKFVEIGGNYYPKSEIYGVSQVLGSELQIATFGKETPLFLFNDNGICLIAPLLKEKVKMEEVIELSKIARIEYDNKHSDNDPLDKYIKTLKEGEKINLVNKLISELGISI